jgi:hypothetical protein
MPDIPIPTGWRENAEAELFAADEAPPVRDTPTDWERIARHLPLTTAGVARDDAARLVRMREDRDVLRGEMADIRQRRNATPAGTGARRGLTQALQRRNRTFLELDRQIRDLARRVERQQLRQEADRIDLPPLPNFIQSTECWPMRRELQLTTPLREFDEWEDHGVEVALRCKWPFARCHNYGQWARRLWLDTEDRALQQRIPFSTLCEDHWMNRGQLELDIPEPAEEAAPAEGPVTIGLNWDIANYRTQQGVPPIRMTDALRPLLLNGDAVDNFWRQGPGGVPPDRILDAADDDPQ